MKKISALGLDIGSKRIGVAGCDGTGLIATGLTTITRSSLVSDLEKLQAIIKERDVEILVIGVPYSIDGNIGFQAKQIIKYAKKLSKRLNLPLEYVDERLTSVEAEEQLKASKRFSAKKNKDLIDKRAAAIILQQWLDENN
jgi:putative Holliday junction resolvase